MIDQLPIPDWAMTILDSILPDFILNLKAFIILLTWKWLTLLPGEKYEIDLPPIEAIPQEIEDLTPGIFSSDETLVTQEDYNSLIEDHNSLIEDHNSLIEDHNSVVGDIVRFKNYLFGVADRAKRNYNDTDPKFSALRGTYDAIYNVMTSALDNFKQRFKEVL